MIFAALCTAFLTFIIFGGIALIILGIIEAEKRERVALLERENIERAAHAAHVQGNQGQRRGTWA